MADWRRCGAADAAAEVRCSGSLRSMYRVALRGCSAEPRMALGAGLGCGRAPANYVSYYT